MIGSYEELEGWSGGEHDQNILNTCMIVSTDIKNIKLPSYYILILKH